MFTMPHTSVVTEAVLLVCCVLQSCSTLQPIRNTSNGAVAGVYQTGFTKSDVEAFYGIPYATPPVDNLRFEDPVDHPDWSGVRQATELPPICHQIDEDQSYNAGHREGLNVSNEDCLYLNVFVPITNTSDKLAVMLFIHGGSNVVGTGLMFDGNYLASHGRIVVVTMNYRLAALGFLGTGGPDFRGNYAMMDQIMCMKWIKNNIANFRGDPDKVTVLGHSSGSMDVGLHLVSPLSKGLFRAVICQSGPPTTRLAWKPLRPNPTEEVVNVSRTLGCDNETISEMKQCLKNVDPITMMKGAMNYPIYDKYEFPVLVDGRFLPEEPIKLFRARKFNAEHYALGFTTSEGDFFAANNNFTAMMDLLDAYHILPSGGDITDTLSFEYTDWENLGDEGSMRQSSSNLMTDSVWKAESVRTADLAADGGLNVTMYEWARSPSPDNNLYLQDWYRVPHGIDLFYLFGSPLSGHHVFNFAEIDIEMSKLMMECWSNYVKHLVLAPNSEIDRMRTLTYDSQNKTYIRFGVDGNVTRITQEKNPVPRQVHFWLKYLPKLSERLRPVVVTCPNSSTRAASTLITMVCAFLYLGIFAF